MHDLLRLGLLIASAVLAGAINTLAGGGTLLTFPALLQFGALSAVTANATSTVALVSGSLAGAWGYRRELGDARWWLRALFLPSLAGGLLGAWLMVYFPDSFERAVPWLLLTASLLFLFQPAIARRFPPHPEPGRRRWWSLPLVVAFQFLVAVYGGYFGAGIGILMISSLSLMGVGDIHRINAVKTLLAAVINGVSIVLFVAYGVVEWRLALPMAVGAILGGYGGARLARRLPRWLVRWFVIAVGLTLAGYYFVKPG